jgi:hypothetical protein
VKRGRRALSRAAAGPIAALLLACGAPSEPVQVPQPGEPAEAGAGPRDTHVADVAEADARSEVELMIARALDVVSSVRRLPARAPVRGELIARDAIAARVRADLVRDVPPHALRGQEELLVAFGVVPIDFDYVASTLALLGSELAGFYDPRQKAMFLVGDLGGVELQATLWHELVHALQDQHWDLQSRVAWREDAGDAQSAMHALAEGDASSAMMDAILFGSGRTAIDSASDEKLLRAALALTTTNADVPPILMRSVVAPYLDGLALVHAARRRGGWTAVDALWADPPHTTEQLLHAEKLLAREPAVPVEIPVGPSGGPARPLYHDVLGEQSVRLLFEEWLPHRTAVQAAAGWAGDRVVVLDDAGRTAVAWLLAYDDRASAERGFEALVRWVARPAGSHGAYAPKAKIPASGEACRERSDLGPLGVRRRGQAIAVVAGPYTRSGGRARAAGTCREARKWLKVLADGSPMTRMRPEVGQK